MPKQDEPGQPITVLKGVPGSGKSKTLIDRVNHARTSGIRAHVFLCSDSPTLAERSSIRDHHVMACREPGTVCDLDHFVSTHAAIRTLDSVESGALVAFDEAYWFGPELAAHWVSAAERGVTVIVALPSPAHEAILAHADVSEQQLQLMCQRCERSPATVFFVTPATDSTMSVCASCEQTIQARAAEQIRARLQAQAPFPGEKRIYLPVFLCPEDEWRAQRADSHRRLVLMKEVLAAAGISGQPARGLSKRPSYLDLGCNTGYFCRNISRLGLRAEGVDAVADDIQVAELIDSHFSRAHTRYIAQDVHSYLLGTRGERWDVTSAFSIIQWVMSQRSTQRGGDCLTLLFDKTRRVCFVELGHVEEEHDADLVDGRMDARWARELLEDVGQFDSVLTFPSADHGLQRDLFAGIRRNALPSGNA